MTSQMLGQGHRPGQGQGQGPELGQEQGQGRGISREWQRCSWLGLWGAKQKLTEEEVEEQQLQGWKGRWGAVGGVLTQAGVMVLPSPARGLG